jgi:hypothetical protein
MRHHYTPGQTRMLISRARRQLEQIIDGACASGTANRNITRSAHPLLHETVVSLIRLFREHVPGAAGVATRIAREYAKGADVQSGAPTLDCVKRILSVVRQAGEQYLSDRAEMH